ncbi:MAG: type II toxin-antitoxin system VapC family toxin [Acidobacteriota bacterium]
MILIDVNVLIYAFSNAAERHAEYRQWLESTIEGVQAYGVSELILSSFVRIVTHPRVLDPPAALDTAIRFCTVVRDQPNAVVLTPGSRHWSIFVDLCRSTESRGNLISDAYLAALAIETGSELISTDRDFTRFPKLKWRHPLAAG